MQLTPATIPPQRELDWLSITIQQAVEAAIQNTRPVDSNGQPDEVLDVDGAAKLLTTETSRNIRGETVAKLTKKGIIPGTFLGMGLGWRYSRNAILNALSNYVTQESE